MLEEKYDMLELPQIQPTYIIFNRENDNIIQNNITYHKNILSDDEKNIEKIWLSNTDNIIKIVKGKHFKINEKILMIQRYLHNDLNISYKDVLNVEILYTENVKINDRKELINESIENVNAINSRIIHRYPNEGRAAIDFQATILDTFIDCDLKRENLTNNDKQMYIIVMVCNNTTEKKVIGELVNRYLFIENKETHEYKYRSPQVYRRTILPQYNIPNYIENNPFYQYNNNNSNPWSSIFSEPNTNYINSENFNSQVASNEQKRNYSNRIQELEQKRERELNDIRQAFFHGRNRRTDVFSNNIINEINIDEIEDINPLAFLLEQNQTTLIGNLVNLLVYVNGESMNIGNIENLMEPVRVTVSENDMTTFLTSFKFSDNCNLEEYKRIKIKEQTTCPICLSNYENDEMVSYLNTCNHLFHTTCISKWLTDFNHKCPVCRLSANPSKNNEISPNVPSNEQNSTLTENSTSTEILTDNEIDNEIDE